MYVVLQLLFAFAALGLLIAYFFVASVVGISTTVDAITTVAAAAIAFIVLLYFSCGLNAGLMRAYAAALEGKKITLAEFLRYSLQKSAPMFLVMLLRDVVTLVVAGPLVVLYTYSLKDIAYMDLFVTLYVLGAVFLVHFLFTPAFISMGAFGTGVLSSLRNGFGFLKRRHVYALGLYFLFAIVWLLNFLPVIQLVSIFAIYPVVYAALIVMFQGSGSTYQR